MLQEKKLVKNNYNKYKFKLINFKLNSMISKNLLIHLDSVKTQ